MPRHRTFLILLVVLGSLALGLYGCGKISMTSPGEDGLGSAPTESPQEALAAVAIWPQMQPESDTVRVSCDVVCVKDEDNEWRWTFFDPAQPAVLNYFIVPVRAIEENKNITVAVVKNIYWVEDAGQWGFRAEFDFGPDGLKFKKKKPELLIDALWLGLEDGEKAVLRYYNPETDLWEKVKTKKVEDGVLKFKIEHFSKYAVSR